jgi:hypothetical protein
VTIDTEAWLPVEMAGRLGYWLRLDVWATSAITVAEAFCVGVAAPARHASPVGGELVGISDGRPRQRFRTARAPVLADRHRILVGGEEWRAVDSLVDSGPVDTHVELDTVNGEILFGDGTHGAIPSEGAEIVADYLTGEGAAGNVTAHALTILRDPIPRRSGGWTTVRGSGHQANQPSRAWRKHRVLRRGGWPGHAGRVPSVRGRGVRRGRSGCCARR